MKKLILVALLVLTSACTLRVNPDGSREYSLDSDTKVALGEYAKAKIIPIEKIGDK